MVDRKDDSPALAAFLQALGLTICGLESLQPEDRTRDRFIMTFNRYQETMIELAGRETGHDVRVTVKTFNREFEKVMKLIDTFGLFPKCTNS